MLPSDSDTKKLRVHNIVLPLCEVRSCREKGFLVSRDIVEGRGNPNVRVVVKAFEKVGKLDNVFRDRDMISYSEWQQTFSCSVYFSF